MSGIMYPLSVEYISYSLKTATDLIGNAKVTLLTAHLVLEFFLQLSSDVEHFQIQATHCYLLGC